MCDPKKLNGLTRGLLIAALFEVVVEPHLIQPHHIIRPSDRNDSPLQTAPRSQKRAQERLVERFESFIVSAGDLQRLLRAQRSEIQRRLARSSKPSGVKPAMKRRAPWMKNSSRRSARECPPQAGLASASTA